MEVFGNVWHQSIFTVSVLTVYYRKKQQHIAVYLPAVSYNGIADFKTVRRGIT